MFIIFHFEIKHSTQLLYPLYQFHTNLSLLPSHIHHRIVIYIWVKKECDIILLDCLWHTEILPSVFHMGAPSVFVSIPLGTRRFSPLLMYCSVWIAKRGLCYQPSEVTHRLNISPKFMPHVSSCLLIIATWINSTFCFSFSGSILSIIRCSKHCARYWA